MRSFILMAIMAILAFVSAIPITPAAPQLQKRAEQFRLEGLREVHPPHTPHQHNPHTNAPQFDIAQRLSAPISDPSDSDPFLSRLNHRLSAMLDSLSSDEDEIDVEGDIAPGSMEAPQMLPKAAAGGSGLYRSLCRLFQGGREEFGYEGKEEELRRPEGMKHWGGGRH